MNTLPLTAKGLAADVIQDLRRGDTIMDYLGERKVTTLELKSKEATMEEGARLWKKGQRCSAAGFADGR